MNISTNISTLGRKRIKIAEENFSVVTNDPDVVNLLLDDKNIEFKDEGYLFDSD
jgi:hypothetical protein